MKDQLKIDFNTNSPINKVKLTGQNERVLEMLQERNITTYDAIKIGIYNLHSRISDLRNKAGVTIHDRFIKRQGSTVKEYSLKPF